MGFHFEKKNIGKKIAIIATCLLYLLLLIIQLFMRHFSIVFIPHFVLLFIVFIFIYINLPPPLRQITVNDECINFSKGIVKLKAVKVKWDEITGVNILKNEIRWKSGATYCYVQISTNKTKFFFTRIWGLELESCLYHFCKKKNISFSYDLNFEPDYNSIFDEYIQSVGMKNNWFQLG